LGWDLLKPWGCCFVEDVVTLQVSLLFTEGGVGGCKNVMWTALDWDLLKPWGCCFVEDVVTLQVSLLFAAGGVITSCGREDEKGVMFISSMVLQWIMTFSSCQQNDQKCMKPQFQWFRCCTHVWPSMDGRCEFITLLRGQTSSLSAPTLQLLLIEQCERRA